jgi:hypothetical protein
MVQQPPAIILEEFGQSLAPLLCYAFQRVPATHRKTNVFNATFLRYGRTSADRTNRLQTRL